MSIEEVRSFFSGDRFATENGMVVDEAGENYSVCSMEITDKHRNARGGLMGGVHFTLADFAFAVATNDTDKSTVTISSTINYYSAVKGTKLLATAKCVKEGRVNCYYDIDICDDKGTYLAKISTVGRHL